MDLEWNRKTLIFSPVVLKFEEKYYENVFALKNNKTLKETINHERYIKFRKEVMNLYAEFNNWELGKFLYHLKTKGDTFYLKFLNKYGDGKYCRFYINDEKYLNKKGIYVYTTEDELRYIGRCRDNLKGRINQGYGNIHPKNCYVDGQATNCHLNTLITEHRKGIKLFVHLMEDNDMIKAAERNLIKLYKPQWNKVLKSITTRGSYLHN